MVVEPSTDSRGRKFGAGMYVSRCACLDGRDVGISRLAGKHGDTWANSCGSLGPWALSPSWDLGWIDRDLERRLRRAAGQVQPADQ